MPASDDDFLLYLREAVIDILTQTSEPLQVVELLTEKVVYDWGSQRPYIPKKKKWQLDKRDKQIYKKFNGRNRHELCREFGISDVHFYSIIKRVRAEMQTDLFNEEA